MQYTKLFDFESGAKMTARALNCNGEMVREKRNFLYLGGIMSGFFHSINQLTNQSINWFRRGLGGGVLLLFCSITATAQFTSGDGTEADPYIITTASELAQLATLVNAGNTDYDDKHYKLGNDIDLSDYQEGEGWIPIGVGYLTPNSVPFKGVFDGNNYVVTGLVININTATTNYKGLFGRLIGGVVKNLGVVDANISVTQDSYAIGIIAGEIYNTGSIENCHTSGSIYFKAYDEDLQCGGILGHNYVGGTVNNCRSSANITTHLSVPVNYPLPRNSYVGGIVGDNRSNNTISNCSFTGSVHSIVECEYARAGGIAGRHSSGNLLNCWSSGTVIAYNPEGTVQRECFIYAGGIVGGTSSTTIKNCYSTTIVQSYSASSRATIRSGGIAGDSPNCTIENCVALNPLIFCKGGYSRGIGRITSTSLTSSIKINNYGFTGTFNTYGVTEWTAIGLNLIDGADITLEEIFADGTLGGLFTEEGGWVTENGKLPGIEAPVEMPPFFAGIPFVAAVMIDDIGLPFGSTKQLTANIAGFNLEASATWTLEGGSSGTSITPNGLITIAANETAKRLTVTATSIDDNTKSGSGSIMILGGGEGTEEDPYILTTAGQMFTFSEFVAESSPLGTKYFKLGNDIDLSEYGENYNDGTGWKPIGDVLAQYSGTFDGGGYIITGLYSNITHELTSGLNLYLSAGLFGNVIYATIKNVGLVDVNLNYNISSTSSSAILFAGGLAGQINNVTIDNCFVTGSLTATFPTGRVQVGGILGTNNNSMSQIKNCWTDMTMFIDVSGSANIVAGIAGVNYSVLSNCYSLGQITCISTSPLYLGGIVGNNGASGNVINCWSSAEIKAFSQTDAFAGGISGSIAANSFVTNCAALNPSIVCEGTTQNYGRITGRILGTLTNNIAYDNMINPNEETVWENIGENNRDGANIDRLSINTDGTLGGLFTNEDVWVLEDGKLPGIGQPVDMPLHLMMPDGTFTVSGKVTGIDIEDEIEGVVVTLSGLTNYSATTDASGNYVIENVDGGMTFNYTLRATLYGYYTYETTILVLSDLEYDIMLNVIPKFTISGNVKGSVINDALEGVEITLTGYGELSTTTNVSGDYSIEVYDGYTYIISATKSGYAIYTASISIEGNNVNHNFSMVELLFPVQNVTATVVENNALIEWDEPTGDWIKWCVNDVIEGRLGWDVDAGNDMTAAIRFLPSDLANMGVVYGNTITKLALGMGTELTAINTMELKIWEGGTSVTNAGTLVYSQPITNFASFTELEMNEVELNTPYIIDPTKELRIGYRLVNSRGYPIGADAGPIVAGKGTLFQCPALQGGNWVEAQTLLPDWQRNFSIKAFVNSAKGFINTLMVAEGETSTTLSYQKQNFDYAQLPNAKSRKQNVESVSLYEQISIDPFNTYTIIDESPIINESSIINETNSRAFLNYDIYRLIAGQPAANWTLLGSVTENEYLDTEWENLPDGTYQYAVKAKYGSGSSASVLSNALVKEPDLPDYFTVTVIAGTGGTVEILGHSGTSADIEAGTPVTVKATANAPSYEFLNWTIDGVEVEGASAEYQFVVTEDVTLVANFEPIIFYHTVTVSAGTGGTVEIVGYENLTELIEAGTSVTVKATANQNYDFIEWTDTKTGETISSLPVYSFTVSEDVTLTANFELVGINGMGISGYTIYPNPATSELRVEIGELRVENIEIFDVFGRKQKAESRKQKAESGRQNGDGSIVVDVSHLPAGVYMIRLFDGQNYVTQRFVKK